MTEFQRLILIMRKANVNRWGNWVSFYLNYCKEEVYNENVFKETSVFLWNGYTVLSSGL